MAGDQTLGDRFRRRGQCVHGASRPVRVVVMTKPFRFSGGGAHQSLRVLVSGEVVADFWTKPTLGQRESRSLSNNSNPGEIAVPTKPVFETAGAGHTVFD